MTAYNRERYISDAIESVLNSTYENFELIVVDDKSLDHTAEVVQQYVLKDSRVKLYLNEQNLGDYPNRNKAASYAKGKYIKYLDSDDLIYYYGLEVMVNYMEQFTEVGFGLAAVANGDRPYPVLVSPREIYLEHFQGFSHFDRAPGSSIIKLDAFNRVGGFSGERMVGDYEFWFRIARYYNLVKFPRDLCWNRSHHEQESRTPYAAAYPVLKKQILSESLKHPDCPLSTDEVAFVRKLIKKNERKHYFLRLSSRIINAIWKK
jgi:glycosyltransferase involved in cell wall biosynthesis